MTSKETKDTKMDRRPTKSPPRPPRVRMAARDNSDSPAPLPITASEPSITPLGVRQPITENPLLSPPAVAMPAVHKSASIAPHIRKTPLATLLPKPIAPEWTQQSSTSGEEIFEAGIRPREGGRTGTRRSKGLTDKQLRRLEELCEYYRSTWGYWPTVTRLWNAEYPDDPADQDALRAAHIRHRKHNRSSVNSQAASDATTTGSSEFPALGMGFLDEHHANYLAKRYESCQDWLELTLDFAQQYPEFTGITQEVLQRFCSDYGCIPEKGGNRLTTEQSLYALELYTSHGGKNMARADANIVFEKLCEAFQGSVVTKTGLNRAFRRFGANDAQILKGSILQKLREKEVKRANKQKRLQNHTQTIVKQRILRAKLDIETLKIDADPNFRAKPSMKAERIKSTTAYQQFYDFDQQPSDSTLVERCGTVRRSGQTVQKLESLVSELNTQLVSDEEDERDESEWGDSQDDEPEPDYSEL